ncbi:MAG: DUF116 domain-containing protein [Planctomycetota bacterium]
MDEKIKEKENERKRKLGEEWESWDGDLDNYEADIREPRRTYLSLCLLALLICAGAAGGIYYLILPRLEQWHPLLPQVVFWVIAGIAGFVLLGYILLVFSVLFRRNFLIFHRGAKRFLVFFQPFIFKLGRLFGISKDRIGHSFIHVSNAITEGKKRKTPVDKLLIILPRCLNKAILGELKAIAAGYDVKVFVAGGGGQARKLVREKRPEAVIGVACERDLVAGIADVAEKAQVIALPNVRPEGPCRNTIADIEAFKQSLRFFLEGRASSTESLPAQ